MRKLAKKIAAWNFKMLTWLITDRFPKTIEIETKIAKTIEIETKLPLEYDVRKSINCINTQH